MKHPAKHILGTLLGLILVLSAVPGHAQDGAKIKATIPFNFVVGNIVFSRCFAPGLLAPDSNPQ